MQAPEVRRVVAAVTAIGAALDLNVDDAIALIISNKLALRLLPCDVFARVSPVGHEVAQLEIELALRLAETESPVAALEPRVEPRPSCRPDRPRSSRSTPVQSVRANTSSARGSPGYRR